MNIPDEYKTGNKKMDEKIARALLRDPIGAKPNLLLLLQQPSDKNPRIRVSEKENRTFRDGTLFASKTEMERWEYLLAMQREGLIKNLRRQVPFILQEEFISKQHGEVHAITYVADFVYTNISLRKGCPGREVVEDSKGGQLTDTYKLKKKMFLYRYGEYLFFEV